MATVNASDLLFDFDKDYFAVPGSERANMTLVRLFLEALLPTEVDEILSQLKEKYPQLVDVFNKLEMHVRSYEEQLMQYDEYRAHKFILLYVPPILIILGTFGNIFSFIILKRKAMLKFSTYYYLMVLAIADTMVLYIGLLRLWIGELTGYDVRDQADWLCKLINVLGYTVSDFSVWLIIAVTVERYIVVCHPLKASSWCNTRKARVVILSILVVLFGVNSHCFWTVGIREFTHNGESIMQCAGLTDHAHVMEQIWPWMDTIIYSLLPFIIIIVLNAMIIHQVVLARRHRMELRSGSMHEHAQRRPSHEGNTRLTIMLLTITFAFLLTTLPMTITNSVAFFLDAYKRDLALVSKFQLARTITELLMYINHAMNFFLYCATGQKFRHQLVWMICYSKRPYNMNMTLSEPTTQPTRLDSIRNGKNCVLRQSDNDMYMSVMKSDPQSRQGVKSSSPSESVG